MNVLDILKQFVELQEKYAFEKRNLITPERYHLLTQGYIDPKDYSNQALIETLTEHVGHLPIIASFFHPYLEQTKQIDLGKVLIMLSIHDIGETVVGDTYSFLKTPHHDQLEREAAIKTLHANFVPIYEEYEGKGTLESKYAHSVDKLGPLLGAIKIPKVTIAHALEHRVTIEMIESNKQEYFAWEPVLREVFDVCISHYRDVREGGKGLF